MKFGMYYNKETIGDVLLVIYKSDVIPAYIEQRNDIVALFDKDNENTAKYTKTAKDFNEALSNLFADEEFTGKITAIRNKQSKTIFFCSHRIDSMLSVQHRRTIHKSNFAKACCHNCCQPIMH